jgi:hypothetical protein
MPISQQKILSDHSLKNSSSKEIIMNPFWKTILVAIGLYTVLYFVPVLNGFLGWLLLIFSGFFYMRNVHTQGKFQGSPVAYGLGMGALIGTLVRLGGSIVHLILAAMIVSTADVSNPNVIQAGAAIGTIGTFFALLNAPLVGGLLGGLGGLIAGALMPQNTMSISVSPQKSE